MTDAVTNFNRSMLIPVAVAAALGIASSTVLFVGSWMSLIPWAIAGGCIGFAAPEKKIAMTNGAAYGFVLPIAFTLSGYSGATPLFRNGGLWLLCLVLGVIGAGCGATLALIGRGIKTATTTTKTRPPEAGPRA